MTAEAIDALRDRGIGAADAQGGYAEAMATGGSEHRRIMYAKVRVMMRPLILVTCWRRHLPTFLGERTLLDTLDPAYADRVVRAGGQPLLVSRPGGAVDEESVRDLIERADGVLLTGGGDVDPVSYGAARDDVEDDDRDADRFELAILDAARAARVPTLAICRGAQLLAVAHGGSLAQRPAQTGGRHERGAQTGGHGELGGLNAEQIRAARHPVTLVRGSRVERAFDRPTIEVNTIHHHQIADAGDLQVTARAPDGVIEAVEPCSEWACVGVQWHPEKMAEAAQNVLFDGLVQEARGRGRRAETRSAEADDSQMSHALIAPDPGERWPA